jgi:hypothetical protein
MANAAAYSGLRWGELTALTIPQVDQAGKVITVDRKVVEVAGHLYVEAPKTRKFRRTIYPRHTRGGYPIAERLAARIEQARVDQEEGGSGPAELEQRADITDADQSIRARPSLRSGLRIIDRRSFMI